MRLRRRLTEVSRPGLFEPGVLAHHCRAFAFGRGQLVSGRLHKSFLTWAVPYPNPPRRQFFAHCSSPSLWLPTAQRLQQSQSYAASGKARIDRREFVRDLKALPILVHARRPTTPTTSTAPTTRMRSSLHLSAPHSVDTFSLGVIFGFVVLVSCPSRFSRRSLATQTYHWRLSSTWLLFLNDTWSRTRPPALCYCSARPLRTLSAAD